MKRMPSTLIDFLNATPTCHRADLFAIKLPNGRTLYATDGQLDISVTGSTPGNAFPFAEIVTIPGTAQPWLDPAYPFSGQDILLGGPPVSIGVSAGAVLSLSYVSGEWSIGPGVPFFDANGALTAPVDPSGDPSSPAGGRCLVRTYITQLLGAWADASGALVAAPFPIGDSATITAPGGATQLLLGMNDAGGWSNNLGSVDMYVTSPSGGATVTFKSGDYGVWTRGRIVSEASSKLSSNSMDLTCVPQPLTQYPGLNLGILNAALNHLFDGAEVRVFTAYMPIGSYGDVSAGIECKFRGFITRPTEIARNKVVFECYDPFSLLNLKVPARLFQATCPWSFTDVNCTLPASDYAVVFTAASGSNQKTLTPSSAFSQADGYFAQGVVTCLTGGNAGLSQTVKLHTGGVLTVMSSWLLPIAAGDTFSVIKGCDKTLSMCKATIKASGASVDNSINFGGTPFVPVPQTAI
jgi:uncharacterized phage protein (TIGR02218 family)